MLGTVFGISILLILTHAAAFWGGAKLKEALRLIPVIGRLF